jgi:hypothetical protein
MHLSEKLSTEEKLLDLQPQKYYFGITSFFYTMADAENLRQAAVPVEVGGAGGK